MMRKRLAISNKVLFALLSISLVLCIDMALGSTLDVYVDYKHGPAGQADVFIDNDTLLGETDSDGALYDIKVNPGVHTIAAKWQDNNGKLCYGERSFTALSDSYTLLHIDVAPRNLGWIWQFMKNMDW